MSTTASAAAIARNSVLSSASTSVPGSRRTSSAMRADRRPSSMLSSVSGAHRLSAAARRSGAHSVRGSVFIDTDADVIVSTSSARASVRGSFMEMRANMEMDVLADDPSVLAYDSPLDNNIPDEDEDMDEDEDALGSVQALTRWSHRFSVPPNPFVDPDEDPLTNPAGWTRGESAVDQEDHREEEQRRRTNASLDALAAMRDNEDVHQGTSHAMLRLMGVRDPPPAATAAAHDVAHGYDPDDPHAAILDPSDLGLGGLGIGSSLADDLGGGGAGLSLEEELADAELKRFSTMLDRVASQIEDLRVSDTKLTASLEKVCARCRMIQTAGPGVREYLDPCDVHGMPDELDQAPSR
ncbi:hypothetical protein BCR44DRAFT_1424489 [Catenaria anguillulae PL171]|uniref:Uncharacterized protein n=1 Tax=Catenaria anguillulae PL171 TaxID=765915 RepID=A0A1Y2I424_9FUNG|nr:hypothetical protein BCR44DRAFT_1424489 [Catenaria anguillulae PL171]